MLDLITARLQSLVPDLAGRVGTAAALSALLASDRLPQQTPFAHVIPADIVGKARRVLFAQYDQPLTHVWAVILTVRSDSGTGARALERLPDLLIEIVTALAGWVPVAGGHEMGFRRARLLSFQAGTIVYELTFDIDTDLRIDP